MNPIVVIPARMAATRLPGKPLAAIHGRPMIAHVLDRARAAGEEGGALEVPPPRRDAADCVPARPSAQALRAVIAPLASNSLELVKATSIAALVALPELLRSARVAQEQTYNPTPLMAAAVIYFVLLWPFAHLVARLERRMLATEVR